MLIRETRKPNGVYFQRRGLYFYPQENGLGRKQVSMSVQGLGERSLNLLTLYKVMYAEAPRARFCLLPAQWNVVKADKQAHLTAGDRGAVAQ